MLHRVARKGLELYSENRSEYEYEPGRRSRMNEPFPRLPGRFGLALSGVANGPFVGAVVLVVGMDRDGEPVEPRRAASEGSPSKNSPCSPPRAIPKNAPMVTMRSVQG